MPLPLPIQGPFFERADQFAKARRRFLAATAIRTVGKGASGNIKHLTSVGQLGRGQAEKIKVPHNTDPERAPARFAFTTFQNQTKFGDEWSRIWRKQSPPS
jgi:hypothetical protein